MSATAGALSGAADYVALVKPRINAMALLVAAAALWLAPGSPDPAVALVALLGIGLVVGAANALNMVIERDVDRLMERTRERPLPGGRLAPWRALVFGLVLAGVSLPALWILVNPLTAALSAIALVNYVALYTPLKRRTPWALPIGAVSGAMPALTGWTAATGRIDGLGLGLFLVLFLWQVPHFLAISIYRTEDYERAGIRTVPIVHGDAVAKRQTFLTAAALVPLSLALVPLGQAGLPYAAVALAAGAWFCFLGARGLSRRAGAEWARGFFVASLVYVPALLLGLVVDGAVR